MHDSRRDHGPDATDTGRTQRRDNEAATAQPHAMSILNEYIQYYSRGTSSLCWTCQVSLMPTASAPSLHTQFASFFVLLRYSRYALPVFVTGNKQTSPLFHIYVARGSVQEVLWPFTDPRATLSVHLLVHRCFLRATTRICIPSRLVKICVSLHCRQSHLAGSGRHHACDEASFFSR